MKHKVKYHEKYMVYICIKIMGVNSTNGLYNVASEFAACNHRNPNGSPTVMRGIYLRVVLIT